MKLYCVDSFDAASWSNRTLPLEERARRTGATSRGSSTRSCPFIHADCGGAQEIATLGVSLGAFHAVNFALQRADLFPLAIGLSGNYDPSAGTAGASAARPPTSTTRSTRSPTLAATTSTGCARG